VADAAGWLPREVSWAMARAAAQAQLPIVIANRRIARPHRAGDGGLLATAGRGRTRVGPTDLGLRNLAFDPATGNVNGLFDYAEAAWVDRHYDFRYLVFGAAPGELLDATLRAYGEAMA
jgi:hypothetical protein